MGLTGPGNNFLPGRDSLAHPAPVRSVLTEGLNLI